MRRKPEIDGRAGEGTEDHAGGQEAAGHADVPQRDVPEVDAALRGARLPLGHRLYTQQHDWEWQGMEGKEHEVGLMG